MARLKNKTWHRNTQNRVAEELKEKTVSELISGCVNIEVTTRLDGTVKKIEVKYNSGGGHYYINTGRKVIETRWDGERRSHPLIDEPEAERKIEMMEQYLINQHKAMR